VPGGVMTPPYRIACGNFDFATQNQRAIDNRPYIKGRAFTM